MLEILKETTIWNDGSIINHTYLLEGTKIVAYAKFGGDEAQVLRKQLKIVKRHRTFVNTKNSGIEKFFTKHPIQSNTTALKVLSKPKEIF